MDGHVATDCGESSRILLFRLGRRTPDEEMATESYSVEAYASSELKEAARIVDAAKHIHLSLHKGYDGSTFKSPFVSATTSIATALNRAGSSASNEYLWIMCVPRSRVVDLSTAEKCKEANIKTKDHIRNLETPIARMIRRIPIEERTTSIVGTYLKSNFVKASLVYAFYWGEVLQEVLVERTWLSEEPSRIHIIPMQILWATEGFREYLDQALARLGQLFDERTRRAKVGARPEIEQIESDVLQFINNIPSRPLATAQNNTMIYLFNANPASTTDVHKVIEAAAAFNAKNVVLLPVMTHLILVTNVPCMQLKHRLKSIDLVFRSLSESTALNIEVVQDPNKTPYAECVVFDNRTTMYILNWLVMNDPAWSRFLNKKRVGVFTRSGVAVEHVNEHTLGCAELRYWNSSILPKDKGNATHAPDAFLSVSVKMADITEVQPKDAGSVFIAHQTNCKTRRVAGLAWAIFQKFKEANTYDRERDVGHVDYTSYGRKGGRRIIIANLNAQLYGGMPWEEGDSADHRIKYFSSCLSNLEQRCREERAVTRKILVAFPVFIGCDIAGGNWEEIYLPMIDEFAKRITFARVVLYWHNPAWETDRRRLSRLLMPNARESFSSLANWKRAEGKRVFWPPKTPNQLARYL